MSLFRPIASAPVQKRNDEKPLDILVKRPKRSQNIALACNTCRQRKAKCDGARPRCGACVSKDKDCTYRGDDGNHSRSQSMKARLEALESTMSALQGASDRDAERLLQELRSAKDISGTSGSDETRSVSRRSLEENAWMPSPLTRPVPDALIAREAVDAFFSCSGKLFHVFSQAQVATFYKQIFERGHNDRVTDENVKVAACCLGAVAAVGLQYVAGNTGVSAEEAFYEISRSNFEATMVARPLDAIKVCTLLAMYNIMNKVTIAMAYVEIGLSLSRRARLDDRTYRDEGLSPESWIDYRKTWRTLMFFSSWISCTLGYVSGNDILSTSVPLAEMDIEKPKDLADMVQAEMAKISLLKAHILRIHTTFKELTVPTARSILDDLQKWYDQLPPNMYLNALQADKGVTNLEVRRSIYHVHLLYLGAIILLYRQTASSYIKSRVPGQTHLWLPNPLDGVVHSHAEQGVLAAKQSSRIIRLLRDEDGVYKRCWLVIFQSYASCVIILHSVAQKRLFNREPDTWDDDLRLANQCLLTLKFCSTADPVAKKFHGQLKAFYDELTVKPPDQDSEMPSSSISVGSGHYTDATYLLSSPQNPPSNLAEISRSLIEILCRPFSDPEVRRGAEEDIRLTQTMDPGRAEPCQLAEKLDLECEISFSFTWDVQRLGVEPGKLLSAMNGEMDLAAENRFLESSNPQGWSSEPNSMRPADN